MDISSNNPTGPFVSKTVSWERVLLTVVVLALLMGISFYAGHEIPVRRDNSGLYTSNIISSVTPTIGYNNTNTYNYKYC